jgi:hypothetical protein
MTVTPICLGCTHYKGSGSCDAFALIPEEILLGADHKVSIEGDGGIVFEPRAGAPVDSVVSTLST